MTRHVSPSGPSVECMRERFGECRTCDLIDREGPHYNEAYRRLYFPEEFPPEPIPIPSSSPEEPGLLQKAATFGKAIVSHLAAGMPGANEATVERRWETCRGCEMFDAERVTCRQCGCHLGVKIRWDDQHCPIGKW